ncbi:MAG: NUDIX domain-containing protein [Anaerolineae bacterium]|nr:NUDIX domain-containing protein [Anaerolineae bacterium]
MKTHWMRALETDRARAAQGSAISQTMVDEWTHIWAERLGRPSTDERFDVCDETGQPTGIIAPRWLCHLLGLRHRAVHVLLQAPNGLFVLQVRSHDKADWPGLIDVSVGGHLRAGQDYESAARREMEEELGITPTMLAPPGLVPIGQPQPGCDEDPRQPLLLNRQFNQLYIARLAASGLDTIRFQDGEVCALYLCNAREVERLVSSNSCAPGLTHSWMLYQAKRDLISEE